MIPDIAPYFERVGRGTAYIGTMIKEQMTQYGIDSRKQALLEVEQALRPFAQLLQDHNDKGDGTTPVFGINDAIITVDDLRRVRELLKELDQR